MSALATADLSGRAVESTVRAPAGRAWFYPSLGCAALLIAILAANPFNPAGFNDDWSYARVAMKLAETGRLQYNGWGSPILLFQSFWALPWIRAFGFSFFVLQASMIPVSAGFVLLVYATARYLGLSKELSAFASMATGTSPLFLPFAASFMTEAPGCLFSMLCVYAALRVSRAAEPRGAARWLWILAVAGLIGGANRQVVWIAPITLIPWLAWMRRSDRRFLTHAIAACAVAAMAILTINHFLSQPYGPFQLSHDEKQFILRHEWSRAANLIASVVLSGVVVSLPAWCCLIPLVRRRPLAWWLISAVGLATLTCGELILTGLVAPYGNAVLTWVGIATEGQEWFGSKPASLAPWIRLILTAAVNVCVAASVLWLARCGRSLRKTPEGDALAIFGVFSLGCLALTLPGAMIGFAFDRYMAPILPLAILAVLMQFATHRCRVPITAWACLLAFACYGIATTHDYSASMRARVAAADMLRSRGIARDRISVGFEYDGWTQLEHSEYVGVVEYKDLFADDHAKGLWFWFWNHTPDLHPDYVVLNWTSPEPARGVLLKVDFRAWLPPFQRSAVAWRRADLTDARQAVEIAARLR